MSVRSTPSGLWVARFSGCFASILTIDPFANTVSALVARLLRPRILWSVHLVQKNKLIDIRRKDHRVLTLHDRRECPSDDDDLRLAGQVAGHVAAGLPNATDHASV